MTEKQTDARLRILAAAAGLIAEAGQAGLVVTIATTPKLPLAMGNYKFAIGVRDKRGVPAPAAEEGQEVDDAPAAPDARDLRIAVLEDALRFYAKGDHFGLSDKDAWDTVSGEPPNWWCDEAGTATIEDGTLAAMALKGTPLLDEEEQDQPPRPGTAPLSGTQIEALAKKHGATSYRNRADTQHPAYGFTEAGLLALIAEVRSAAKAEPFVPFQALQDAFGRQSPACWCSACDSAANGGMRSRMSVCPACGDKRCPRALHHERECDKVVGHGQPT